MENGNEEFVPEIDLSLSLGADATTIPVQEETAAAIVARLKLDEETAKEVKQLLEPMGEVGVTEELVRALATAVNHEEEVSNAEATGYLRGRNENIEAECHFSVEKNEQDLAEISFPRYVRRSVWD